jgi:hypothetical protein
VSPHRYSRSEIVFGLVLVIAGILGAVALWLGRPCLDCPILPRATHTAAATSPEVTP